MRIGSVSYLRNLCLFFFYALQINWQKIVPVWELRRFAVITAQSGPIGQVSLQKVLVEGDSEIYSSGKWGEELGVMCVLFSFRVGRECCRWLHNIKKLTGVHIYTYMYIPLSLQYSVYCTYMFYLYMQLQPLNRQRGYKERNKELTAARFTSASCLNLVYSIGISWLIPWYHDNLGFLLVLRDRYHINHVYTPYSIYRVN